MHIKKLLLVIVSLVNFIKCDYKLSNTYENFIYHCETFNCYYNNESEKLMRYNIFKENINFINEHNMKESNFKLGLSHYSTLTNKEYRDKLNLNNKLNIDNKSDLCTDMPNDLIDSGKKEFNWVTLGKITDVKNQLECGSCWAFSTIGSYENWYANKMNIINNSYKIMHILDNIVDMSNNLTLFYNNIFSENIIDFSEQELVDCDNNDNGCNGGLMNYGLSYIIKNGICDLKSYPYNGVNSKCSRDKCELIYPKLNGCYNVPPNNNKMLKLAVEQNAVSIAIEADTQYFQHYISGVLDNTINCGTNLDHGVLLVGYGVENNVNYWLVKNSWGYNWGESGYVKLLRSDSTNDNGICGIAMSAVYPW